MPDALSPAIPAATLVIFRQGAGVAPELLMVERAKAMAFAAGALVFPGGRVDPEDYTFAAMLGGDAEEDAHRIAAIRETIEEAGLAIGLDPLPGPAAIGAMRASLHAGISLAEALAAAKLRLDLASLISFARWRPAHANMRIFDTRFYLAQLPPDAPAATVDATENVRLFWASAQAVLDEADAERATIIYPTRRNLERLAQCASFADAAANARAHPIRTITPYAEQRVDGPYLCIPGDLGYPITSELMRSAMRG